MNKKTLDNQTVYTDFGPCLDHIKAPNYDYRNHNGILFRDLVVDLNQAYYYEEHGNYYEAIHMYFRLASEGEPRAALQLGKMYINGDINAASYHKAINNTLAETIHIYYKSKGSMSYADYLSFVLCDDKLFNSDIECPLILVIQELKLMRAYICDEDAPSFKYHGNHRDVNTTSKISALVLSAGKELEKHKPNKHALAITKRYQIALIVALSDEQRGYKRFPEAEDDGDIYKQTIGAIAYSFDDDDDPTEGIYQQHLAEWERRYGEVAEELIAT